MMVLIRFWRSLTKKDSAKSARCKIIFFFFNFNSSFRTFFHGSGFFRIGSGLLVDPDSEKRLIRIGGKTRIRDTSLIKATKNKNQDVNKYGTVPMRPN